MESMREASKPHRGHKALIGNVVFELPGIASSFATTRTALVCKRNDRNNPHLGSANISREPTIVTDGPSGTTRSAVKFTSAAWECQARCEKRDA